MISTANRFFQFIDSFVPQDKSLSADEIYRGRILIGLCLSIAGIISLFLVYTSLFHPEVAVVSTVAILVPMAAFFFVIAIIYKKTGKHHWCGNVLFGISFVGVIYGVYISGGVVNSPASFILSVPMLMAFCLSGKKSGVFWAVLTALTVIVMVSSHFNGYVFPNQVKPEDKEINVAVDWGISFLLTIAIILIYDNMNERLQKQRDEEKDKYRNIATSALESQVVTESAENLASSSDKLLEYAIQQKTAIEQLSVTSEELGATAEQNNNLASDAKATIGTAEQELLIGKADLLQMVQAMDQVKASSDEIRAINNLINELSYQTNILSLNAMIEASRAGDEGGGFKVVALEVKKLAERSANAAENINRLLETNVDSVNQGVTLSETMKERFESIVDKMSPLSVSIQNVADASYEQSTAIKQIMDGLADIDKAVEANQNMARTTADAASELNKNAASLVSLLDDFEAE